MKKVTIVQRVLPHYRLPFYHHLNNALANVGISFHLVYGQEELGTVPKTAITEEPWATLAPNTYWHIGGQELVWQKTPRKYLETDLLIVEQANRLLNNYPLIFFRRPGRKLAFWGHGRNMQDCGYSLKEAVKKRLAGKVDWWFAYTDISKQEVSKSGFPADRITTVNNSIDTETLQKNLANVQQRQVDDIFAHFNITSPQFTCLYCGGLYPDKKLDFLVSACEKVQKALPEFSLIVVGGGPEEYKIQEAAARFHWLHYAGPKFGTELAPFFKCTKALLMPGLVGLVVIDSFVAGVPLFTTDNKIHSPEIAYLRHGENGIITSYDEEAYSEAVISFLKGSLPDLSKGCLQSAHEYTLDNMVANFANGIQQCLSMEKL